MSRIFGKTLISQVEIVIVISSSNTSGSDRAVEFAEELAQADERISTVIYSIEDDQVETRAFNVNVAPTIIITRKGEQDGRIRFMGRPYGYMFTAFVEAVRNVSRQEADLSLAAVDELSKIRGNAVIRVFTVPSCRYSPMATITANRMAILNPHITVETIDTLVFADDADSVGVKATPHIIINGKTEFIGSCSDDQFARYVLDGSND